MRFIGLCLGLICFFGGLRYLHAQFETPEGRKLSGPKDPYFANFTRFSRRAASHDLSPTFRPGDDSAHTLIKLSFLETVTIFQQARVKGESYFLIGKIAGAPRLLGWVDARLCIADDSLLVPGKGFRQKCILTNRLEAFAEGNADLTQVNAYKKPSPKVDELERYLVKSFELNNLFFIYSKYEDYVLIGSAPRILSAKSPDDVIDGWVHKDRIAEWNSREGFEWLTSTFASRGQQAVVYASGDDARRHMDNPEAGLRGIKVLFKEDLDPKTGRALPWPDDNDMRFPLLGVPPSEDRLDGNRLYKIGAFRGGHQWRRAIEQLRQAARKIDILIIVDDSQDMDQFFPAVASSVRAILSQFSEALEANPSSDYYRDIRVSVAYFADRLHSKKWCKPASLIPIVDRGQFDELVVSISKHKQDGGGDAREDVLDGIIECYDGAGFRPDTRRMVIVVGDEGDKREVGSKDFDQTVDKIAERMVPASNRLPVEFYAVSVKDKRKYVAGSRVTVFHDGKEVLGTVRSVDEANEAAEVSIKELDKTIQVPQSRINRNTFANHMAKVALAIQVRQKQLLGVSSSHLADVLIVDVGSDEENAVPDALGKALIAKSQDFETTTNELIEKIREIGKGNLRAVSELGDHLKTLLAARLKVSEINKNNLPQEVFHDGFIWRNAVQNDVPQFKQLLLVQRTNLTDIYRELARFDFRRPEASLEKLRTELLEGFSGDKDSTTLQQYFLIQNGLEFRSPLFRFRPNELQKVGFNRPPQGGTFALEFNGEITSKISYDADASLIQSQLESLRFLEQGNVVVTGAAGGPWTISFRDSFVTASIPLIVGHDSDLKGGASIEIKPSREIPSRDVLELNRKLAIVKDLLGDPAKGIPPRSRDWKYELKNGKYELSVTNSVDASRRWFTLPGDPNKDEYIWLDPEHELP